MLWSYLLFKNKSRNKYVMEKKPTENIRSVQLYSFIKYSFVEEKS